MIKHKKLLPKHKVKPESIKYVMLNNPNLLRKDILLNALDIVKVLKGFNNNKYLKEKKLQLFKDLHSTMNEINHSFLTLHRHMPIDESLKEEIRHKNIGISSPLQDEVIKVPRRIEDTEEDRLREELREVERRLKRMNF